MPGNASHLPSLTVLATGAPCKLPSITNLTAAAPRAREIYSLRTACEHLFRQAVALHIEQSKFRNRSSIANLNTLIYFTPDLRALVRMLDMQDRAAAPWV
jgi:hypothetical protein